MLGWCRTQTESAQKEADAEKAQAETQTAQAKKMAAAAASKETLHQVPNKWLVFLETVSVNVFLSPHLMNGSVWGPQTGSTQFQFQL